LPSEIDYLINGHNKFWQRYYAQDQSLYAELAKQGQKPKYLVIACSDSRVDPAIIMDCKPGDLFVVRNVANLVPPCEFDMHYHGTSAALEFGICDLGIKHVIILGHSQCGGITALLDHYNKDSLLRSPTESFIAKWMGLAATTCQTSLIEHANVSLAEQVDICAKNSILSSLKNLNTFPWIKEKVNEKSLFLHAWYFDLITGKISSFDHKHEKFETY